MRFLFQWDYSVSDFRVPIFMFKLSCFNIHEFFFFLVVLGWGGVGGMKSRQISCSRAQSSNIAVWGKISRDHYVRHMQQGRKVPLSSKTLVIL